MTPAERAAARVDYQLSFHRSPVTRVFSWGELTGGAIDCARTPGNDSRGGWSDYPPRELTEDEWVDWFVMMALQECVHEALEWCQVDGRPWLDPHILENKVAVREVVLNAWRGLRGVRALKHE